MPPRIKRIYEPPEPADEHRVLVDRIWPRGVSRDRAALDEWLREIAPSDQLRRWFSHDPSRWNEFKRWYARELSNHHELVEALRRRARYGTVTLLYSARDRRHNQAVALADYLSR